MKRAVRRCFRIATALTAACVGIAACVGAPRPWTPSPEPVFTFAVLADPHVPRETSEERLRATVAWINEHREAQKIELVFVLGDLGEDLALVARILSELKVPYVPLIGDGAVQHGREKEFHDLFRPQMARLAGLLEGWREAPVPVHAPEGGDPLYLHDFAFVHRGVRFLGLDWCTRSRKDIETEQADLHAFPGGTFPFFRSTLEAWDDAPDDSILLLSHHQMHAFAFGLGSFSPREMAAIEAVTSPRARRIHANLAGHYHLGWQERLPRAGYTVYVTDAVEEACNTLRLLRVHRTACGFAYEHRIYDIPWSG